MGKTGKSIAVMQPYVFPYIGYFQLVNAVDEFVFYDDVQFIKRGWINRNKILVNGKENLISFPCIKASQNKQINDVHINTKDKQYRKILQSIKFAYKKAKYFDDVFPVVEEVLTGDHKTISDLCIASVSCITDFLDLDTTFKISSQHFPDSKEYQRNERLKAIAIQEEADSYINAIGGVDLYDKSDFEASGLNLRFLKPSITPYAQFDNSFVSHLSIIDVMMFNSKEECRELLDSYDLV